MHRLGVKRKEVFMDLPFVESSHDTTGKRTEMIETVFTTIAFAETGELVHGRGIVLGRAGCKLHASAQFGNDVSCCMRST